MATLRLYRDGRRVASLDLGDDSYLVGRGDACDLKLDSPSASRRHFTLSPSPEGGYEIRDLGSENGLFVDGKREFHTHLLKRAMVQVGEELMLYDPEGGRPEVKDLQTLPQWALDSIVTNQDLDADGDADATRHIAPAHQRRKLAQDLGRIRPHLVQQLRDGEQVFPLDGPVTAIGHGALRVSLAERAKPKVLAEVVRSGEDSYVVRAKGLLARIEVNGKAVSKAPLNPGDKFTVDGVKFRFEVGLVDE